MNKPAVAVVRPPKPSTPPPMFVIDPQTRKPQIAVPSSIPTTTEEKEAYLQSQSQTQSWGRTVVIRKTSESDLAGMNPEEGDLFKVDKDAKIELRSASDVANYEQTYGDREIMEFLDAQVTEDIRRFESGELSEDEF
jgi:hypothetical protein